MEGNFSVSQEYENNLDIKIRKKNGIYYTPKVIVDYIVDEILTKHDIVENPYPRVLDLSCGCGNFLLKVYDLLYVKFSDNLENLNKKYGENFISRDTISAHIIKNCIYGVDTDPKALEICRKQILDKIKISEIYPLEDEFNLICFDSLKLDFNEKFGIDRFDYIVGNPPYIGHKLLDKSYKQFLYKEYKEVYRDKGDLYFCFYKKILDLLKEDGIAGIITPRYFMQSHSGKDLRDYMLKKSKINTIVDFLGAKIFKGLGIASCIVIFSPRNNNFNETSQNDYINLYKILDENININKISSLKEYLSGDNFRKLKVNIGIMDNLWIMVEQEEFNFYNKIQNKCGYILEDICVSFQGIITGCDKAFVKPLSDERLEKINKNLLKNWIKNKDVGKYIINDPQYKLIYSNDIKNENDNKYIIDNFLAPYKYKLMNRRECVKNTRKWYELQWGRCKYLFEQVKIMYPYKSKNNRFAIDFSNSYASADVYSFYIKQEYREKFSYEYLVALLNSNTYDRYFKIIGKEMGKKIFDYYPNRVMKLKIFKDENYNEIERLSKQIIALLEKAKDITNEINRVSQEIFNSRENLDLNKKKILLDKKISLSKEKDCLEINANFLENKIEEIIQNSLNL